MFRIILVHQLAVVVSHLLNKASCCLKGHKGGGQSFGETGTEGAVPGAASCHPVLRLRQQQLQRSAEAEEGLGDPTYQRGREFPRTLPTDARQRK